jgi:hypothetical protein
MFRDLEKVQDTRESRLTRQLRSNIRKPYQLDRVHLDLAFLHAVTPSYFDVGTYPNSDTASDFSAAYSLAKSFAEHHDESLLSRATWIIVQALVLPFRSWLVAR